MAGLSGRESLLHSVEWWVITIATVMEIMKFKIIKIFIEWPFIWLNILQYLCTENQFIIYIYFAAPCTVPPGASASTPPHNLRLCSVSNLFSSADFLHTVIN